MAQLSDDCFAFGGPLMTVADAERIISERLSPVTDIESVALREARGRVLADDLLSPVSLPPFDNSAVDGYAVRHCDLAVSGPTRLRVVERVFAGGFATAPVGPEQAVRIFTGAPMPEGADTVYMQEDCSVEGDDVMRGQPRRVEGHGQTLSR